MVCCLLLTAATKVKKKSAFAPHVRWNPRDALTAAGLYVAGVLARLPFVSAFPHTPEGGHYFAAQTLASKTTHVFFLGAGGLSLDLLFWGRPIFFLTLAPGAQIGFEATRIWHMLLGSFLPVLVFLILRKLETRLWLSAAAGLTAAIHTYLVVWTTFLLPDALATLGVLLAVYLYLDGKTPYAAIACLAAAWTKEIAALATIVLLVHALIEERRNGIARLWPLKLGYASTALGAALAVSFAPMILSMLLGARAPGWGVGGARLFAFDRMFLIGWLWIPILVGLLWARTRLVASLPLAFGGFYVAYRLLLGRTIEIWYFVTPAVLGIIAVFATLDELSRRVSEKDARARWASPLLAILVVALLVASVFLPVGTAAKGWLVHPFTRRAPESYQETLAYETGHANEMRDALDAIGHVDTLFAIDIDWSDEFYPLSLSTDRVVETRSQYIPRTNVSLEIITNALESGTDATLVQRITHDFSDVFWSVYADCAQYTNDRFMVLRGADCAGRRQQLEDAWHERVGAE